MEREVNRYLEGLDFERYPDDGRYAYIGVLVVLAVGFGVVELVSWLFR